MGDDLRTRDLELVALAAHRLDQNGQVQLAASRDDKLVGCAAVLDTHADVGLQFAIEPRAQLARGAELALASGEWAGIDAESHLQGGLLDGDPGQRFGVLGVGHRVADVSVGDAGQRDDIAGGGLRHLDSPQTLLGEDLTDTRHGQVALARDARPPCPDGRDHA